MKHILQNQPSEKLLPKLVPISPYQIYLHQIKSAIEPIRFGNIGIDYFPPQFGGIFGQRNVINEVAILQMIDFEVK